MKTFKTFLQEIESSTTDPEEAIKLIQEHCSKFLEKNNAIYRGVKSHESVLIGDSTKGPTRASKDLATNFYTRWMDTEPAWDHLPRRGESFICTNDSSQAKDYGSLYRVFPYDDALVGIVPDIDIWYAFSDKGIDSLAELQVNATTVLRKAVEHGLLDMPINFMDPSLSNEEVRTVLRSVSLELLERLQAHAAQNPDTAHQGLAARNAIRHSLHAAECDNLEELFDQAITPDSFEVGRAGEIDLDIPESREIYIQGRVVMVHHDMVAALGLQ